MKFHLFLVGTLLSSTAFATDFENDLSCKVMKDELKSSLLKITSERREQMENALNLISENLSAREVKALKKELDAQKARRDKIYEDLKIADKINEYAVLSRLNYYFTRPQLLDRPQDSSMTKEQLLRFYELEEDMKKFEKEEEIHTEILGRYQELYKENALANINNSLSSDAPTMTRLGGLSKNDISFTTDLSETGFKSIIKVSKSSNGRKVSIVADEKKFTASVSDSSTISRKLLQILNPQNGSLKHGLGLTVPESPFNYIEDLHIDLKMTRDISSGKLKTSYSVILDKKGQETIKKSELDLKALTKILLPQKCLEKKITLEKITGGLRLKKEVEATPTGAVIQGPFVRGQ
jgi:hypothetical protein